MKSFRKLFGAGVALIALICWPTGGVSLSQVQESGAGPSGEGNIPIGRAQGKDMGESAVVITQSNGRVVSTFTKRQVVYASQMPRGMTDVRIIPANRRFAPYTFSYYAGTDQFWSFTARPSDRMAAQTVKYLDSSVTNGQVFRVGDTVDLNIQIYGAEVGDLEPSIYISGGIARIDNNDNLVCTRPGIGQVQIEVGGFEKSINFAVEQ